jgi:hypothetical protein
MRSAAVVAGIALLAGCTFADAQVRKRAASDFGCPEEDVRVDAWSPGYVAQGCRKEAAYVVRDGRVTRESEIRSIGETRPPLPIDRVPGTNSIGID